MNSYELPAALTVAGTDYPIRTDFRDVLYVLEILASPDYEPDEKGAIVLRVMYQDWEKIPQEHWAEALERAAWFMDGGFPQDSKAKPQPRLMDWSQDAALILPAVNRVLGREVRGQQALHWWTFLGAYMEIGESLFSTVLSLRQKRAKGKKLEKHELEFYRENRSLVELRRRDTEQDKERRAALKELFV